MARSLLHSSRYAGSLYEGQDGFPTRRGDTDVSDVEPPRPAPPDTRLRWTLSATPPAHWIPYSPVADPDGVVELIRAEGHPIRGDLSGAVAATLADRLVGREGIRIQREFARVRDADGHAYVWACWRRRIGRGETSSGLAFDVLLPE